MKKGDKRNSHISRKLHTIYIYSNNVRHPLTKNLIPLHYTSPNYTSLNLSTLKFSYKLYPSTLHCT
jgi:hypothetical protein